MQTILPTHPQYQVHHTRIDPTAYPTDHPMSIALRTVARHWHLCYSKLLSLRWEWSDKIPYGATDGARLLLNREGLNKLANQPNGAGLTAFLLVHEALHALLGHGWRCSTMKDSRTANVAADYIINAMIAHRNRELGREVFPFIDGVLLDEQLSGNKSVEKLYRELLHNKPQQPQPKPQPQTDNEKQDKQDSEESTSQEGSADPEAQGDPDTDTGGEDDGSEGPVGCDPDPSGDGDEGADGDHSGSPGEGDGQGGSQDPATDAGRGADDAGAGPSGPADDLSDFVGTGAPDTLAPEPDTAEGETLDDVVQRIEEDNDRILTTDAIDRRVAGTDGTVGARIADQRVTASRLDWTELCREWLNKRARLGWDSPFNNPIYQTTGLICAGRRSNQAGTIVLALDTSGSIGADTYAKFLQQAQDILDELKPESLILLSVSHTVMDSRVLQYGDIVPSELKGGGGTAFKPAFDWLMENDIDPDVMIYLTDGMSYDLPQLSPVDFPLLWLSTYYPASAYPIGDVLEITDI